MIERADRLNAEKAPRAIVSDGLAKCPACAKPLAEPLCGGGRVAVWCRRCRKHIIVQFNM